MGHMLQGKHRSLGAEKQTIEHKKHSHDEKKHAHVHSASKYHGLPAGLQELARFHGHLGPYAIVGYKMGSIARTIFELEMREKGLNIKDIVAYSKVGSKPPISCVSDGIQMTSGCTLGKGNIKVIEEGKVECRFVMGDKEMTISLLPKLKSEIDSTMSKEKEIERSMWIYDMDCAKLFSIDAKFSIDDVLDKLAVEMWKKCSPSDAFNQGLDDCAGKMFVATDENLNEIDAKLTSASWLAELSSNRDTYAKFFKSMRETILFQEPHVPIVCAFWSIFGHLVKGKKYLSHIGELSREIRLSVHAAMHRFDDDDIPLEKKALAYNQCTALLGIMDSLRVDARTKEELKKTAKLVMAYRSKFAIPGVQKGEFEELFPIFAKGDGRLGRVEKYPKMLANLYDYPEDANEILQKGEKWLEDACPRLEKVANELAKIYGLKIGRNGHLIEKVDLALAERTKIPPAKLVEYMQNMRKIMQPLVKKRLVSITPSYDVRVMKTPDYLVNIIPSAAMCALDALTNKPFAVFFLTCLDNGKEGGLSVVDMLQMLIHEEYGHCVNYLNSAQEYACKLPTVAKLHSGLSMPITEGISFHREQEFLDMMRDILDEKTHGKEEKAFIDFIRSLGDVHTFALEMEFYTLKWQVLRFLRIIGDVRVNLEMQKLSEFVEWAARTTGLDKRTVFHQVFVFQENPGYAPCYAITGMSLKSLQQEALKRGKGLVEFNTFACSLGFPPRTSWEARLREF